jgi:hypothetical protein
MAIMNIMKTIKNAEKTIMFPRRGRSARLFCAGWRGWQLPAWAG